MSRTRVEVNELGEFFTIIPDEIVEELELSEGELIDWEEDLGSVQLSFP